MLAGELAARPELLDAARIVVVAGGFSYGDALGAGRMLGPRPHRRPPAAARRRLRAFVAGGRPVIGICNGFQVLTRTGLLPGALGHNDHGRFDCRGSRCAPSRASRCIWTAGLDDDVHCPIAHGEGRYVHPDPDGLAAAGQVALRYAGGNPNGSVADIAGVCDPTGVVLGLMPHPENHVVARQHPRHRHDPTTTPHARPAPVRSGGAPCQVATPTIDPVHRHRPAAPRPARRQGPRAPTRCATSRRLFVTTDRLSAFDRIIAGVPYKGQVLNQLAAWWFDRTVGPRRQPRRRRARPEPARRPIGHAPLPVEVVVRGYITGVTSTSLWKPYADGRPDDLRLPLPRRAAEEHRPARAARHADDQAAGRLDRPRRAADVGRGRRARASSTPTAGSR